MVADGQVRLGKVAPGHCADDKPGKEVRGVFAVCCLASYRYVLVQGRSGGKLGVAPGSDLIDGVGFQPQAAQQLFRLLLCDFPCRQIPLIVGVQILIHPAVRQAVPV